MSYAVPPFAGPLAGPLPVAAPPRGSSAGPPPAAFAAGATAEVLARAAAVGDARAFALLVERYHARCVRFARNMGLPTEDAEEAVQDAFVRVHRALPRFDADARFEPWLFRVLANRCRSAQSRGRWYRRALADGDGELARCAAPDDAGAGAAAEAVRDRVARALAALPADQREAFLLRHVEDLSYEDIARATGARLSTLRMRVKRACDALRLRLREEEFG